MDTLGLGFRQMATLQVLLTGPNATPVASATVNFTIVATFPNETAAGATLSAAMAVTDDQGHAQVDLFAGASPATFRVTAEAENAGPVTFSATVADGGFADLVVTPVHVGARSATPLGSVEVHVYIAGTGCAAVPPESPPTGTYPVRTAEDGASVTFPQLAANSGFSVLAFAKTSSGAVAAAGCVDLAGRRPAARTRAPLPAQRHPRSRTGSRRRRRAGLGLGHPRLSARHRPAHPRLRHRSPRRRRSR
jgi:hypothetical protein